MNDEHDNAQTDKEIAALLSPMMDAKEPDWAQRLADAEKRGYFTDDDDAEAAHWHSCAVGEWRDSRAVEHNRSSGEPPMSPQDDALHFLGRKFAQYVSDGTIEDDADSDTIASRRAGSTPFNAANQCARSLNKARVVYYLIADRVEELERGNW